MTKSLAGRITGLHPVESVDWHDCTNALLRLGLELPTEAQWEYAARGGTDTVFWCGDTATSIQEKRAGNIADATVQSRTPWTITPEVTDGHFVHAPVGSFAPNPFGLHDVLAPINAGRPAWPEDELRAFGPYGLAWASDRWDLRRALVLEGTKRESPTGESELAVMRLWVDLQTLYPLYYVAYDKKGEQIDVGYYVGRWSEGREDYPRWSDDPERPVRVIDPVGEAFANLHLKGSWRRESWTIVSVPESDNAVRRTLSLRSLQRGK